jgi:hypothetical protein
MTSEDARRPATAFFLALWLNIFWGHGAAAHTAPIDDTGTQALQPAVAMRWKSAAPTRGAAGNLMTGAMTVRLHLNLMPWLHHAGRIYLVLPAQAPGPMKLSWTTQGRLLPGQVVTGNRTLVYAGPVTSRVLEDVLYLQFTVDASLMGHGFPVDIHFEMDEE